ncbi:hypothetical protein CBR_g50368 [Chara braunii]|uniref:PROP1-like PPR domain-containing protein n=1 Tax=Chara braunii TaxID=69332 RepID=A0A388K5J7_CHABU|nr:hypothetical protein CBR_g50368 [Chara braunii]|eukprot:GBG65332.1 hypothetical protein CBR_g50368 [Chara braunii]
MEGRVLPRGSAILHCSDCQLDRRKRLEWRSSRGPGAGGWGGGLAWKCRPRAGSRGICANCLSTGLTRERSEGRRRMGAEAKRSCSSERQAWTRRVLLDDECIGAQRRRVARVPSAVSGGIPLECIGAQGGSRVPRRLWAASGEIAQECIGAQGGSRVPGGSPALSGGIAEAGEGRRGVRGYIVCQGLALTGLFGDWGVRERRTGRGDPGGRRSLFCRCRWRRMPAMARKEEFWEEEEQLWKVVMRGRPGWTSAPSSRGNGRNCVRDLTLGWMGIGMPCGGSGKRSARSARFAVPPPASKSETAVDTDADTAATLSPAPSSPPLSGSPPPPPSLHASSDKDTARGGAPSNQVGARSDDVDVDEPGHDGEEGEEDRNKTLPGTSSSPYTSVQEILTSELLMPAHQLAPQEIGEWLRRKKKKIKGRRIAVDEEGIAAVVARLGTMSPFADVDGYLNTWVGRFNRRNFPSLMKGLTETGDLRMTMKVFNWMKNQRCYRARNDIYNMLIDLSAKCHRLEHARGYFNEMKEWRCKPDINSWNALINAHTQMSDYAGAYRTFEDMMRWEIPPSRSSYVFVIKACGNARNSKKAREIFQRMKDDGVPLDSVSFNALMAAYRNERLYGKALEVFEEMKAAGVYPDRASHDIMLSCLIKLGRAEEAIQLFEESLKKGQTGSLSTLKPGGHTFNTIMHAYAMEGRWKKAMDILTQMESAGILPNVVTYNILINAFAVAGMFKQAEEIFGRMERSGMHPDVVSYSTLMNAYAKAGKADEVRALVPAMVKRGVKPNVVVFNAVLDAYSQVGRVEDAFGWADEMEVRGVALNVVSYTTLIKACHRGGQPEKAEEVLTRLRTHGVKPNEHVYNSLILLYMKYGMSNKAVEMIREMKNSGLHPDIVTFSTLIDRWGKEGKLAEAQEAFSQMVEARVGMNVEACTALIDAYAKLRNWKQGLELFEQVQRSGTRASVRTYNLLLDMLAKCGKMERARQGLIKMKEAGLHPTMVTYNILLRGYSRVLKWNQALEVALKAA